jgi:hypothetical protein
MGADSITDVAYFKDVGTEETFAPKLFRRDVVNVGERGASIVTGTTRIRFTETATIKPVEAGKLAEALVAGPATSQHR